MNDLKAYCKEYGLKMLLLMGIGRMLRKLNCPYKFLIMYDNFKHKCVQNYLQKNYGELASRQENQKQPEVHKEAYIFWWQGEENAPEVIKCCINSAKRHINFPVTIISKYNYHQYADIPDYIIRKVSSGEIGLAHFSDILRFNLLHYRGGVWLDATDFMTGALPETVFDYSFYSFKNAFQSTYGWKWTSFFMVAQKNNYLSGKMVEFYNTYWKEHNMCITYLVLDCWLKVLFEMNAQVRKEIESYPEDSGNIFAMTKIIKQRYHPSSYKAAQRDSYIHKLSYKDGYEEYIDGDLTTWGYIKQHENINACQLESGIWESGS